LVLNLLNNIQEIRLFTSLRLGGSVTLRRSCLSVVVLLAFPFWAGTAHADGILGPDLSSFAVLGHTTVTSGPTNAFTNTGPSILPPTTQLLFSQLAGQALTPTDYSFSTFASGFTTLTETSASPAILVLDGQGNANARVERVEQRMFAIRGEHALGRGIAGGLRRGSCREGEI
jgi:hypothetical protein